MADMDRTCRVHAGHVVATCPDRIFILSVLLERMKISQWEFTLRAFLTIGRWLVPLGVGKASEKVPPCHLVVSHIKSLPFAVLIIFVNVFIH